MGAGLGGTMTAAISAGGVGCVSGEGGCGAWVASTERIADDSVGTAGSARGGGSGRCFGSCNSTADASWGTAGSARGGGGGGICGMSGSLAPMGERRPPSNCIAGGDDGGNDGSGGHLAGGLKAKAPPPHVGAATAGNVFGHPGGLAVQLAWGLCSLGGHRTTGGTPEDPESAGGAGPASHALGIAAGLAGGNSKGFKLGEQGFSLAFAGDMFGVDARDPVLSVPQQVLPMVIFHGSLPSSSFSALGSAATACVGGSSLAIGSAGEAAGRVLPMRGMSKNDPPWSGAGGAGPDCNGTLRSFSRAEGVDPREAGVTGVTVRATLLGRDGPGVGVLARLPGRDAMGVQVLVPLAGLDLGGVRVLDRAGRGGVAGAARLLPGREGSKIGVLPLLSG